MRSTISAERVTPSAREWRGKEKPLEKVWALPVIRPVGPQEICSTLIEKRDSLMDKSNTISQVRSASADPSEWLQVQQAAETIPCSESTIRNLIARGDLPAYRFGPRMIRIRRQDLEGLLKPYQGGQAGSWSHLN